jgi:hypothetical protein
MTAIERCRIRDKHTHTDEERSHLHRFGEYWGWDSGYYIRLHEDADARRTYEEALGEPPALDCLEDFEMHHANRIGAVEREDREELVKQQRRDAAAACAQLRVDERETCLERGISLEELHLRQYGQSVPPVEVWEFLAAVRAGVVDEVLCELFTEDFGPNWADLREFRAF